MSRSRGSRSPQPDEVGLGVSKETAEGDEPRPELTFWYTFESALGSLPSRLTSRPFHQKLVEYTDWEKRDLWEYDLNLSDQERALLIAHLYELRRARLSTWSVGESTAYQLLAAIDAVAPQHRLTEGLFPLVTVSDAIHAVMSVPGLVSEVHFRPSLDSQFRYRLRHLSDEEFDELDSLLDSLGQPISTKNPAVLDAALDFVDTRFERELRRKGHPAQNWKAQLIERRSQADAQVSSRSRPHPRPMVMQAPLGEMPHLAHGSRRITLGASYSFDRGAYHQLAYRFGVHDFLDPLSGYPDEFDLQLVDFGLRSYADQKRFELEKLTFIEFTSLRPFRSFDRRLSWRGKFGLNREMTDCDGCLGLEVSGGPGLGFDLRTLPIIASLFLDGGLFASSGFSGSKIQVGAGPAAALRAHIVRRVVIQGEAGYRYQLLSDSAHHLYSRAGIRMALWKNGAVGAAASLRSPDRFKDWRSDVGFSFHYYY